MMYYLIRNFERRISHEHKQKITFMKALVAMNGFEQDFGSPPKKVKNH